MSKKFLTLLFLIVVGGGSSAQSSSTYDADFAFESKNYKKAFELFTPLAEQGNVIAQSALCLFYLDRYQTYKAVERDFDQAFKWCSKAVEGGRVASLGRLAYLYAMGYGVERNIIQALKLTIEQSDLDKNKPNTWVHSEAKEVLRILMDAKGRTCLGCPSVEFYSETEKEAVRLWLFNKAKGESASASLNVAFMYAESILVEKNKKQAMFWLKNSALKGMIIAQMSAFDVLKKYKTEEEKTELLAFLSSLEKLDSPITQMLVSEYKKRVDMSK